MAPQVSRIALVFGLFILIFIGVRGQVVPSGFDEDGFHRQIAPKLIASAPLRHAGMNACNECHAEKVETTPHVKKGVHCESCHEAALAHAEDWETKKPKMPSTRADCTRCHAMIVGRPAWYPQIDPKSHNPGEHCISCHEIHPAEEAGGKGAGTEANTKGEKS